jgi:hypothetical protein
MGYITKYGSFWGMIPQTSGQVFWVAPTTATSSTYTVEGRQYSASDGNDGMSPERAFSTINQAIANCTASAGDVIVLLPGSHSWSVTQTLSKAGITITGIPSDVPLASMRSSATGRRARAQITTTASDHVLTPTAADIEIAYLHIVPAAGFAGIGPSAAADRLYVHDCTFNMTTAANTATIGIGIQFSTTASSLDDVLIRNCYFHVSDNQGPAVRAGATTLDLTVENCTFRLVGDSAWDDCIEITLAGSLGTTVRDCDFLQRSSGTVMTDCIDWSGATIDGSNTVLRCYFAVGSDPLEPGNVADNQCAENYFMQAAASVGGTLVLST